MLLTSSLPANQTNYKKIAVYFQEPPRKSRPLAMIAVARDGENATWAVEILKMEAAVLGADALAVRGAGGQQRVAVMALQGREAVADRRSLQRRRHRHVSRLALEFADGEGGPQLQTF